MGLLDRFLDAAPAVPVPPPSVAQTTTEPKAPQVHSTTPVQNSAPAVAQAPAPVQNSAPAVGHGLAQGTAYVVDGKLVTYLCDTNGRAAFIVAPGQPPVHVPFAEITTRVGSALPPPTAPQPPAPPPPPAPPAAAAEAPAKRGPGRPRKNAVIVDQEPGESVEQAIQRHVSGEPPAKAESSYRMKPTTMTIRHGVKINLGNYQSAEVVVEVGAEFDGNLDQARADLSQRVQAALKAEAETYREAAKKAANGAS